MYSKYSNKALDVISTIFIILEEKGMGFPVINYVFADKINKNRFNTVQVSVLWTKTCFSFFI